MFENLAVFACGHIDGPLHLVCADEFEVSDGPILGVLDPEIFDADDLHDIQGACA